MPAKLFKTEGKGKTNCTTKLLNYFYMEIVQLFKTHVVCVRHLKIVYFGRALGLVSTIARINSVQDNIPLPGQVF